MTTIIRAEAAHDFLALVPTLAGFRPERSIVCVAFHGNRTVGVLRHDLPRRGRDRAALVETIIGTLCRIPGVDAVVPVVYSDATFARSRGVPERALLGLFAKRAGQAGFLVRDALCRAADAWGSILDPGTPSAGRPLALIDESAAVRQAPAEIEVAASQAASSELPETDPERAAAIATAVADFRSIDRAEAAITRLGHLVDPVELVEALVAHGVAEHPPIRLAWFLHLASRPPLRDAMMLQVAFGVVVGEAAHDDAVASADRAEQHGESIDELVRREVAEGTLDEVSDLLTRLLLGQSSIRPERRRVERALTFLRRLIADAPRGCRVGPSCIAAWLAWCLGRGSAAGAFLDRALEEEPEHPMASLLRTFIGTGALPDWAFTPPVCGDPADGGSPRAQ